MDKYNKHLKIEQIEASITCLKGQIKLLDDINVVGVASASIIVETVSMLEMELE